MTVRIDKVRGQELWTVQTEDDRTQIAIIRPAKRKDGKSWDIIWDHAAIETKTSRPCTLFWESRYGKTYLPNLYKFWQRPDLWIVRRALENASFVRDHLNGIPHVWG